MSKSEESSSGGESSDEEEDWLLAAEEESEEEKEKEKNKKLVEELKKKEREAMKRMRKKRVEEKTAAKKKKGEKPVKKKKEETFRVLGMYSRYNMKLNQSAEVEGYFGEDTAKSIRIELLEPETEEEFIEYSRLVSKMIRKVKGEKQYNRFLSDLLVSLCSEKKKEELLPIQKMIGELVNIPKNRRSKMTSMKEKKKKADDYARERDDEEDSDSSYDSDSFM